MDNPAVIATAALRASVKFSAEVIGVVDIEQRIPIRALRHTGIARALRQHIEAMSRFVDLLEKPE